jgi:signal transduction histidine kinase
MAELGPALERFVTAGITLDRRQAAGLPCVGVSRTQLEQILVNLVTNAVDAMPDGGELRVGLDRRDDALHIEVADTGIGMDDTVRSQVFEPFFTTKTNGSGNGLGLAIVYAVTTAARGTVTVESAPGAGTVVRVVLPAVEPPD